MSTTLTAEELQGFQARGFWQAADDVAGERAPGPGRWSRSEYPPGAANDLTARKLESPGSDCMPSPTVCLSGANRSRWPDILGRAFTKTGLPDGTLLSPSA